ncbi:hypothetical protein ACFQGT_08400 [Natrialbaceae archaeon GCM10025810]|uniref:DUF7561 family protein n=1 Tax=Halovalidus salilacus TaxID=3075124 RepID=UPI003606EDCC
MANATCDGCGRGVTVAGSTANIWTFGEDDGSEGTALTLELEDGSSHTLCFPCIERLPDHPTAEDVEALEEVEVEASAPDER